MVTSTGDLRKLLVFSGFSHSRSTSLTFRDFWVSAARRVMDFADGVVRVCLILKVGWRFPPIDFYVLVSKRFGQRDAM